MRRHPVSIDQQLAKALSHSTRARVLAAIANGEASPKQVADRLGEDVRNVAYHVRVLKRLGCVVLVETKQRRGATEHFYEVTERGRGKS
jgi:predicted ArsR family transcriptional regulator